MIGRKEEMAQLEEQCASGKFEFTVMYGRRRVGKTTILQEFSVAHNVIFYSAQEKNDSMNLQDFSKTIQTYFDQDGLSSFLSWKDALEYISSRLKAERTILIIDEFPFLAGPNPSIKSLFQHEIDHVWKNKNLFLILCGSSVSFMVNEIMGYKSPLYGRITSSMEVKPFDYLESADFFPAYTYEDKLLAYGILGGIPRYLCAFSDRYSIKKNIEKAIMSNGAFLYDEPQMLLKSELREPGVYNSILEAIARGRNRISEISDTIHEEKSKCVKYISALLAMRLIEKKVPCGEGESSRKTIYSLTDNFYRFWYHYIFANKSYYEIVGPNAAAADIMKDIYDFMGPVFEDICKQYLIIAAKRRELPFVPAVIGRWWGNNPEIKAQDDIDILALDKNRDNGLFCECKYTNRPMPMEEYEDLITAAKAFPEVANKYFLFISRSGYTEPVQKRAAQDGTALLSLKDLYKK